ncbi:MAG TPA: penicillin-binding protein [Vicinamibacterales bacterium]
MAEQQRPSRIKLPWKLPLQSVPRREAAGAPFEWRSVLRSRLLVFALIFGGWTAAIQARLVYLQLWRHDALLARAQDQQMRTVEIAADRAAIYDRNGHPLAISVETDAIAADPSIIEEPEKTAQSICAALESCDAAKLRSIVQQLRGKGRYVLIESVVSPAVAEHVRKLKLRGVIVLTENRRYYPNRQLAASILGYVGFDNRGLGGIEAKYDSRIRGGSGVMIMQVDGTRTALSVRVEQEPTQGEAVELTIDRQLQHIAERELRAGVLEHNANGGMAIIMDPSNGEVLALANYPTFNPNTFASSDPEDRANRAVQHIYEPGSTFKLVTAAAALDEGVFETTDLIDCAPGYITIPGRPPVSDVHPYQTLTFEDVIVKSSNVGAIKAGFRIGSERLGKYIHRFGFGQVLSPDFTGQSRGIVHDPASLGDIGLASVSMGYQIGVTPMQMIAAVSSVANGGTLYEPRIVRAFVRNGKRELVPGKVVRRTVSPETAATLTQIMEGVVDRGTATAAKIEGYTIAGKTGTAAKTLPSGGYSKSDYNVSFVGFVPSRKPALAVIVVIDSPHGKVNAYGGTVAAPIFKRIAEASLLYLGIGPNLNPPRPVIVARNSDRQILPARDTRERERTIAFAREGLMPDLRGSSAREAVQILTTAGLRPRMTGTGFVIEQSIEPGTALVPGTSVHIKLARRPPARGGSAEQ